MLKQNYWGNFVSHVKQICSETNLKICFTDNKHMDLSTIKECYMQHIANDWHSKREKMPKLDIYNQIKNSFGVEKFLTLNIERYEKCLLSQLRYGILPLRVETGRFVGEKHNDRICTLCDSNVVEDQIHFLFYCKLYDNHRKDLNAKAKNIIDGWDNLSDVEKLCIMFTNLTRTLGKYVKNIFLLRRNTLYKS